VRDQALPATIRHGSRKVPLNSVAHSSASDTECPQIKPVRALVVILSLAVRRKGIARCAALHLDCARFANGRSLSVRVGEAIVWAETALKVALQSLPNTAIIARFRGLSKVAKGGRIP